MSLISEEPLINVGLITQASSVRFELTGDYASSDGSSVKEGEYVASALDGIVEVDGPVKFKGAALSVEPRHLEDCRVTVHDVTIGIDFHWQRKESQQVQGAVRLAGTDAGLSLINSLPLEAYLVSVISSEMSAASSPELLKAHAVVSRSWLLAQLANRGAPSCNGATKESGDRELERIRWYERDAHEDFDVCADDHCQRYQGISKAFSRAAFDAVTETRGLVLTFGDEVCDARYSKSCGGITEVFGSAWESKDVPYLPSVYDGSDNGRIAEYGMPLSKESNAEAWIDSSPPAFCNNNDAELLRQILRGFDQETLDFYRWRVVYSQDELRTLLNQRTGIDFGRIRSLRPVERGPSGRLIRLKIEGENRTLVIGKELEIRRALSKSHLYSSMLLIRPAGSADGFPETFTLIGGGWGHGVGLCQIGAAVMAAEGYSHQQILSHYFRNAELQKLY